MLGLGNSLGKTSSNITPGSGGSPPPLGLDKTWSFDENTESWLTDLNGTLSHQASYTPSSDSEKTGILVVTRTNNSFSTTLYFDLSTLPDYDSTSALYYEVVYSIPSANPTGITYTGFDDVFYGSGGDSYTHSETLFVFNQWVTVSGSLATSGSNDLFIFDFDPPSFTFVSGAKVFIDSIRVSHTDFR